MRFHLATAAAAVALAAAPAFADLDARARLGFGGRWIADAATPLALTLTNSGDQSLDVDVSVSQSDSMFGAEVVHHRVVRVPVGGSRLELFLVPGPRQWNGALRVKLEVAPNVPIHSATASGDRGSLTFDVEGAGAFSADQIAFASSVVGVVGDPSGRVAARVREAGLSSADARERRPSERVEALGMTAESLRLAPIGLDGVDAVLVCDPDATFCADAATLEGLLDWVALGGTLAVSLGEHAGAFAASPLAQEMPATWTGAQRVSYADLARNLGVRSAADADAAGPFASLRPKESDDVGAGGRDHLRVERRFGSGRIVLLPYSLREVISLPGIEAAGVTRLLDPFVSAPKPRKDSDEENEWRQVDFTGKIGGLLKQGAFEPPPLPLVVLGIVLYVLVVGPLDWFVLKRLHKERLTTLTFLGAVLGFTVLAYGASLLLFSSGARVNRVVIADLEDGGRDGRQILRLMDIAGYYSPTGADQKVAYVSPSVVLPPGLPGSQLSGVGSPLPVHVMSADPLHPNAVVQLAFRSQRVVRAVSVGTIGPTIDVEWTGEDSGRGVRVTNGLPVDLDDVAVYVNSTTAYSLGPVASGATSLGGAFHHALEARNTTLHTDDMRFGGNWGDQRRMERAEARRMLETMTVGSWTPEGKKSSSDVEMLAGLRKAGIHRGAAFGGGRALVVAQASKFPIPLPGDGADGDVYVVLRKEVSRP